MDELIIIGAGPMGLYGAFTAGMRDLKGRILESSHTYGGQVSALYAEKVIYDVPGFDKLSGQELIDRLYGQYSKYKESFPIHLNTAVEEIIQEDNHFIVNTTQGRFMTKKILIADGGGKFTPKRLEVAGAISQPNIHYTVERLENFRNKDVVVLGGGDSAADWALMLADYAKSIKLVHRRDRFRAHMGTINQLEEKNNVEILTPFVVKDVYGDKLIDQIVLTNTKDKDELVLELDDLLVFYGINTARSNISEFGIEVNREGIIVNTSMQTNVSGIYAVGNSVSYPGKLKMIVTGMGETSTAIAAISHELFPDRRANTLYSSLLIED